MLLVGVDIWVSSLPCFVRWGEGWKDTVCSVSLSLSGNRAGFSSDISLNARVESGFLSCCAVWADCHSGVGVSWCVLEGALRRVTGWWGCLKTSAHFELHVSPSDHFPGGTWLVGAQLAIAPRYKALHSVFSLLPVCWDNWTAISGWSKPQWACKHCSLE